MKEKVCICKNPECKKEFISKREGKIYCSQNCCVFATAKRRAKDKDPKFLTWQGIKIKNGCFAKTLTKPDRVWQ